MAHKALTIPSAVARRDRRPRYAGRRQCGAVLHGRRAGRIHDGTVAAVAGLRDLPERQIVHGQQGEQAAHVVRH